MHRRTLRGRGVPICLSLLLTIEMGCQPDEGASSATLQMPPIGSNAASSSGGAANAAELAPQPLPPGGTLADTAAGRISFPAAWCERAGSNVGARECALADIAFTYLNAQSAACETSALTRGMGPSQAIAWYNYLITYTYGMAGCDLLSPLPGDGINDFGPGNTPAVGVERTLLGRDDAAFLIGQYLAAFGAALRLSETEGAAVEAHLWRAAEPQIDDAVFAVLSACGKSDAGSY